MAVIYKCKLCKEDKFDDNKLTMQIHMQDVHKTPISDVMDQIETVVTEHAPALPPLGKEIKRNVYE